jgi:NAD(P)-dependent dehydrogenase (short-subunit alcohol dehydrogenase family)
MAKPLADKIALVTGASRGIGAATARALAREGAHVIALARTVGGLEELDDAIRAVGGTATLVPASLTDFPALDRLGGALLERYGRLDIMVGNAGILGPLSPLGHVEPSAWDDVIAVNVTANWRLIRAMDPLLKTSEAGRVVFISSGAATNVRAYWGPFAISKAALEVLARSYAAELANTKVRVNVFNPGPVRTRMRAQAMPGEDPATLDPPEQVAEKILDLCLPSFEHNGLIYNYPQKRLLAFTAPLPIG